MENNGMPLLGDKFPKLEVVTTRGKKVLPDDMAGKWFVLFSHPADFTRFALQNLWHFRSSMTSSRPSIANSLA
jgi:peroxiredoxin (alkyl hydroperoxide reductase subunit C)